MSVAQYNDIGGFLRLPINYIRAMKHIISSCDTAVQTFLVFVAVSAA